MTRPATAVATDTSIATGIEVMKFEDAVREGQKVFAKFESGVRAANMRLGEIAAKVETKYGDETLDKLGEELTAALADKSWASVFSEKPLKGDGAAGCTLGRALKRNRSVFRAWDGAGKSAPAPISWAVLMELQSHSRPRSPRQGRPAHDKSPSPRADEELPRLPERQ